ncbi:MAG: alkylmercury lyase family protein [Betaproteobacteria bacterium]|nr:alkylmercury lyase family protein [Betaproteobacteria bacterium]
MNELIESSVLRLNQLLPLKARQDRLPPAFQALHRAVITSLVMRGRPPTRAEIAALVGEQQVDPALARLAGDDLVVLSADRREILGAYPVTAETTPHALEVNGHVIHAMCALDALAVSPLFECPARIRSCCRVTGEAIAIAQNGARIVDAQPATTRVGVRWQAPADGCAAHSLCIEMVFLKDDDAAARWHEGDLQNHSLYTLEEAVAFGTDYFRPLL